MKKLKVVQIGALHDHAADTMDSLRRLTDDYEVLGYAMPEGEGAMFPQRFEGVKRLTVKEALAIPDLDAVIIETSELNLTKYALMAAERGLPIHMDKPGGIVPADFEKLMEVVKQKNLIFHTGYMYRYNPAVMQLMKDIEEGRLGEIYAVEAHMNCLHPVEKRMWLKDFPGGMLFFLGCHLIDLIYRIMGEPTEVLPLSQSTGVDGVTTDDYGMAVLKYPTGVSFAKTCDCEVGGFMRRQLVVCGSKGTVQLWPIEGYNADGMYTDVRECIGNVAWTDSGTVTRVAPYTRMDKMMQSFAQYVRGEKENPYSHDYELGLYRLIMKCCGA